MYQIVLVYILFRLADIILLCFHALLFSYLNLKILHLVFTQENITHILNPDSDPDFSIECFWLENGGFSPFLSEFLRYL